MTLTSAVAEAVDAVRAHFTGKLVEAIPDGAGGAFVIVPDVEIGARYRPSTNWLGFHINAAYPASDVYPHYLGPVARVDGQAHNSAIQPITWRDRPALQISRRSNGWNPTVDNAALKAQKVIAWIATQ